MLNSILIDLFLVVVIGFSVYLSARRGFVRTLVEAVGFVAAVMLTITICTPLASSTYDKIIEPAVTETVIKSVNETFGGEIQNIEKGSSKFNEIKQEISNITDDLIGALPLTVKNHIQKSDSNSKDISNKNEIDVNNAVGEAIKEVSQTKLKPLAVKVISAVYSIVVLTVLMVFVKFLARTLNKMFSFSLVGKLNTALGGLCGLVKGLVVALLICVVIYTVISFTKNGIWIFSFENIEKTYIFKTLISLIKI